MSDEETVTFNQAWKEFLLMRPFTRSANIVISRNSENVVTEVKVGAFNIMRKDGEEYIIDDVSCPSVVFGFPKSIVEEAVNKSILQKLVGKTLPKEQFEIIKNKLSSDAKRTDSRLGCANDDEIQQALSERNFWEVLFSLHQLVEYRLHKLLVYKSSQISTQDSTIRVNSLKRKICEDEISTFKHLVDIAYLTEAINTDERTKALSFDSERDNIAHKLLNSEVSEVLLETACDHGIELLGMLQNALQRIIPRPEVIIMDSFLIHDFLP